VLVVDTTEVVETVDVVYGVDVGFDVVSLVVSDKLLWHPDASKVNSTRVLARLNFLIWFFSSFI